MTAYGFQAAFADRVESGRKPLTLRRARRPPARHALPGDEVRLWTGLRTKGARLLGVGIATLNAPLLLMPTGFTLLDETLAPHPRANRRMLAALLTGDANAIARLDGFPDWASAWAWHDANRDEHEHKRTGLVRVLISWRLQHPGILRPTGGRESEPTALQLAA